MKAFSHFYIYAFVVMLLFSSSLSADKKELINVINPLNNHIAEEDSVSIVVQANSELVDYLIISSDINETNRIEVNSKRSHYCKKVSLHLGKNSIVIEAYKNSDVVKLELRQIYYTSPVYREYKYPPEKYMTNYFHTDKSEAVCVKCHDMSVNETEGMAFEDVTKSNCYECHRSLTGKQHGHAPSVNWLCTSCHSGKVGIYNQIEKDKTKYSVPDPIGEVCFSCHKKSQKQWSESRFSHEPVESGRCNKCHSSHSSQNVDYLRKPSWDLCISCHKSKVEGMHIVRTFTDVNHPTHNIKDPSRPGKDLSCVSCHHPHASNTASLLLSESVLSLCTRCHKK